MSYGAIYLVTNKVNGRRYVGQTTMTLHQRWLAHVSAATTGVADTMLYRAIRKHGRDAFAVEQITTAPNQKALDAAERYWIEALQAMAPGGYNLTTGGMAGGKHAPEVCQRKRASGLRRWANPVAREEQSSRMRNAWTATVDREKHRASLVAAWTPDKKASWAQERASSLAKAQKARLAYDAVRKRPRCRVNLLAHDSHRIRGLRVLATNVETGEVQRFRSARAAGLALGIATSSVHYALQNGAPLHGFAFLSL